MNTNRHITVLLCLNNDCNARCIMCHLWRKPKEKCSLTVEEWKQFIASLDNFKGFNFLFHLVGGEPLLNNNCLILAEYIKNKGHEVVITTNGYLIDRALSRHIFDAGFKSVNISLDSLDGMKQDSIRGLADYFEKAMAAIDNLYNYKIDIGITTVLFEKNLDELVNIAHWVERNVKVTHLYFCALMKPFGSELGDDWYLMDDYKDIWPQDIQKVEKIIGELIDLKKKHNSKIINKTSQLMAYIDYFKDPKRFVKKYQCNLGRDVINVNALGDIYLCFYLNCLGNIRTHSMHELWLSEKADAVRQQIANCRRNCEQLINCFYEEERNI